MENKEFECFFPHPHQHYAGCKGNEPSSVNRINVRKYRHTRELIDEPDEVICERLEKLWINTNNYHAYEMLVDEAKKYNYEFKGKFGEKVKNKY